MVKIRAVFIYILLRALYEDDKGYHNLVGLIWYTYKYRATHGGIVFSIPMRPAIYDLSIMDDNKTAVIRKKEITWRVCIEDYKIFAKAKLEAQVFILNALNETWVM